MSDIEFKEATEADLERILEIYNHYIRTTTASFRPEPVSVDALRSFLWIDHPKYRTFLVYCGGEMAGFCFLSQYKNMDAYDRTTELGLYLAPGFTHRGLGTQIVPCLEKVAAANGFKNIIVSISGENTASIGLFKKLQYEHCGHFKRVGEKFGRVLDVVWFQRTLDERISDKG